MRLRTLFVIAIIGLFLIEVLCLYFDRPDIEQDLLSKSERVLAAHAAGISIDQVSFIGRDATLEGEVATEEEKRRVEALILDEVWDVRVVDNQLMVPEEGGSSADEAAVGAGTFSLVQADDRSITLTGRVPSADVEAQLVAAASAAFPGATINNNLTLIDGQELEMGWLQPVLALLPTMGLVDQVRLNVEGLAATLTGAVSGAPQRDAVLADAAAAIGSQLDLDAQLSVDAGPALEQSEEIQNLSARIAERLRVSKVNFDIGTANLTAAARGVLDAIAEDLGQASSVLVTVEGHTDNSGSIAFNSQLSQQRADAVVQYLISKGISAERLTAQGFGPRRPLATNTTPEGRSENRRVEFSLRGGN